MARLVRWAPFRGIPMAREFRDMMERMAEEMDFLTPAEWPWPFGSMGLAIDVYETPDSVVVKTDVPGIKSEDIEITVTGNTLTIKGESEKETTVEEANYHRRERRYGSFSRSVQLPSTVDTNNAVADFKDGVLSVTFPKVEEVKAKTISIKTE